MHLENSSHSFVVAFLAYFTARHFFRAAPLIYLLNLNRSDMNFAFFIFLQPNTEQQQQIFRDSIAQAIRNNIARQQQEHHNGQVNIHLIWQFEIVI